MAKEYRLIPLDNLPDGASPWLMSDFPVPTVGGSLQANAQIVTYQGSKWYGGPFTNAYLVLNPDQYGFTPTTANRIIFGCRAITQNVTNYMPWTMFTTSANLTGTNIVGSTIGLVIGQEHYVELVIDKATLQMQWWVDGTVKYTYAITQAQWDSMVTYRNAMFGGGWSTVVTWYMKDIYWAYSTGSDLVDRLGPINVGPALVDSMNIGANWKKAVGQGDQDYLTVPVDKVGSLYVPRFENHAGSGSISQRLKLPAGARADAPIKAVQLQVSGQDRGAVLKNVVGTLTQGGQSIATASKQLGVAPSMGRNLSVALTAAPDGGAWTPAKLAATDFALSLA